MSKALQQAIEAVGGLTKLADRMKVNPSVIANWRGRGIPAERVLELEKATEDENGEPQVTRHQLRPDLYPDEAKAA